MWVPAPPPHRSLLLEIEEAQDKVLQASLQLCLLLSHLLTNIALLLGSRGKKGSEQGGNRRRYPGAKAPRKKMLYRTEDSSSGMSRGKMKGGSMEKHRGLHPVCGTGESHFDPWPHIVPDN